MEAVVWTVLILSLLTLVKVRAEAAGQDKAGWISDVIVDVCLRHNTRLVSLHSCWPQAVERNVSLTLNHKGLMQTWKMDMINLPEANYEILALDLDCATSQELLTQASYMRKFTLMNKWILFSRTPVGENFSVGDIVNQYPWLDTLNIFPDSHVAVAYAEGAELVHIYRVGRGSSLIADTRGQDRSDLRRTKLIASTVLFHPEKFRGFYSPLMTDIDTWPKLHYPLIVNLAQQLNFNLELWSTDDYGWERNGSFTGLMGQLQRREIDFAATGFFMRSDRLRVVDFTAESYHIRTTVLFRQPPLSSVSNIFLLPFSTEVWVFSLVYCIVVMVIFSIEKVASIKYQVDYPMMKHVTFMDLATIVLGCICQQGSYLVPEKLSGRITLFFLSLTALFLFTSYSANIVALQQSSSSALLTLTDLVKSPLQVGIQDLQYNRIYFKESSDPATRLLYEKKVQPYGQRAYLTPEQGIENVRKHLFAFNVETNLGYKMISETYMETEKCGLSEIQLFPMPMLSIPLTKRSGYRDLFSQKIRWQRETGILSRNGKLWLPQKPKCEDSRGGTGFASVGLNEFLPALKILFYGAALSVMLILLEILVYHRNKLRFLRKIQNLCRKEKTDWSQEQWAHYIRNKRKINKNI